MNFKHIDFFDSPTMRELQKQAIEKGTLSIPMDDFIKQASQDKIATPTGDLFLDLASLTTELRKKGFNKEAIELEYKFVAFKQAESLFSPILDQAHPDGDVNMGEAKNNLGDVETQESAHEKILEVIKKTPKKTPNGKQAAITNSLKLAANILKIAEVPTPSLVDEVNTKKFHSMLASLKTSLTELNNLIVTKTPDAITELSSGTPAEGPDFHGVGFSNHDAVKNYLGLGNGFPAFGALNSYLTNPPFLGFTDNNRKSVLIDFKNRFSILHNFLEGTKERESINILPNKQLVWNLTLKQVLNIVNSIINFLSSLIGEKSEGELHNKVIAENISKEQAQSTISPFTTAINYLDRWKKIANPENRKLADSYMNIATNYITTINANIGSSYGTLYTALVALNPQNSKFTSFALLQQAANSFLIAVKSLIMKKLASETPEELIKEAQVKDDLDKKLQEAESKNPTIPGAPSIPGVPGPTSNQNTAHIPLDPVEKDHVQSMQFSLLRLAAFLQGKEDQFPKTGKGAVPILLNVGKGKNKADMDGVWGPNTARAVDKAKEVVDEWNSLHEKLTVSSDIIQSRMRQKGVIDAADKNTQLVVNFLARMGGDTSDFTQANKGPLYDKLPKNLQFSQTEVHSSPEYGVYAVTSDVLGSMHSLYQFLVDKLGIEPQILEGKDPTEMGIRGLTVAKWDEILKWFMTRAKYLYSIAKDNTGRSSATNYHADVTKIWNQLVAYGKSAGLTMNDLNKIIPEHELPSGFSGTGGVSPNGKTHHSDNSFSNNEVGNETGSNQFAAYNKNLEGYESAEAPGPELAVPPFGDVIDLKNRYFNRVVQAFPQMRNNLFPFQEFWDWGAREFVNNFTTTNAPQDWNMALQKALTDNGYVSTPNGWMNRDPQTGKPYIYNGNNDPRIAPSAARIQNVDPKQKAMEFLSYLGKAINDAKNDWIQKSNNSKKEKINVYRWQQKWQEAIANKLEEIRAL